jgi:hypothetical protein
MDKDPVAMKKAIQEKIAGLMARVMQNVLVKDPFSVDVFRAKKPLYAALVPDEIFKGSHFERRFTTPFGRIWEDLAVTAADHGLGRGEKEVIIEGNVKQGRLARIAEILNNLEHADSRSATARIRPDWDSELASILRCGGEDIPVKVICDVVATDTSNNNRYAFELKAPLPNSDQTKVSKEKLLKLYAMDPPQVAGAYYALPYNPYGIKANYSWSFPGRWFNMKSDSAVLIGDEFWEKIGGPGTYQAFIEAVNEVGAEYKEAIYREFLGMEPPQRLQEAKLK